MSENLTYINHSVTFYLVVNHDGLFFWAKGFGGYGNSWVSDVSQARVYTKLGNARRIVTFFAKSNPGVPRPVIGVVSVDKLLVLDESERVDKIVTRLANKRARRVEADRVYHIESLKRELKRVSDELSRANEQLGSLIIKDD